MFDKRRSPLLVINHEAVSRINIKLGDDDDDDDDDKEEEEDAM